MNKKLAFVFLFTFIFIFVISPLSAFGLVRSGEGEAVLLQEGEYDIERASSKAYAGNNSSALTAEEYIHNALLSCTEEINVAAYKIPTADFSAYYSDVINDNPDLFFVSSSFEYNYYPSMGTVANIYPAYSMSNSEVEAALEIFNNGADKALSEIDSSMTDLQKAVILHDYVCENAHYPQVDLNTNDKNIYHTAYGLFYDGEVVCAGYTLAYSYLMNKAGVPCEYVSSDAMSHAWNKVKIGNNWYNVDCTWDDFDYNTSISVKGSVGHFHFLKSDSVFATQVCSFHYNGVTYNSCAANDTSYDTAFWDDVTSRIYAVNGDFYYLKPDFSTSNASLIRRTVGGVETEVKKIFVGVNLGIQSYCYDENGTEYINNRADLLARITLLDNRFYITAGKNIISVNTSGKTYSIGYASYYPIGLGVNGNKNLVYQNYGSAETIQELDKLEYFNAHFEAEKGTNYNNYPDINYDGVINAKDYAMIIKKA